MTTTKVGIFNVRLLKAGETYGLNNTLRADKPIVEFFDWRYSHNLHGQFISRHYAETLLDLRDELDLLLDGGLPDWRVTKEGVALVKEFIRQQLNPEPDKEPNQEKTSTVELTLNESGTLINLLMRLVNESGGVHHQHKWVIDLHKKLAVANDKLMHSCD